MLGNNNEVVKAPTLNAPSNPFSTRVRLRPMMVFVVVSTGALVFASVLDGPVWRAASHVDPAVSLSLWWQALRSLGYLPVWLVVALRSVSSSTEGSGGQCRRLSSRALFLAVSVSLAGGLGEILKMLLRRLRPDATGGEYAWRPFLEDPFSTSGLGLPSGHAIVAFAAAWALCRLWPSGGGSVDCCSLRMRRYPRSEPCPLRQRCRARRSGRFRRRTVCVGGEL